jgi:hypothetical protein
MYPVNKPNKYNTPKQRERFALKEGQYFWLSSVMKTYNKEQQETYQRNLEEQQLKETPQLLAEQTNDNTN